MKYNYHTHTYRCGHAENIKDEEMLLKYIYKGFDVVCFTDHAPLKNRVDKRNNMRMRYEELEEYLMSINNLKEKYKDNIKIYSGFECEYLPCLYDEIIDLKNKSDYILLGQHFIIDNNGNLKIFRCHDFTDEDLLIYASLIEEAVSKGLCSAVVHPDIFMLSRKNFGVTEKKIANIICDVCSKYNIPIEINLGEIYWYLKGVKNKISYPSKEFFKEASKYDVKVIYGIDTHFKEQIEMFEEEKALADSIIGEDILNKLNIVDRL